MRPEDYARLEAVQAQLDAALGVPSLPEAAIQRVLMAAAAIGPLQLVARDPDMTPVTSDWLDPMAIDALDRAVEVIGELYDALESALDDVQVMEPGTMFNQQFVDLPVQHQPTATQAPAAPALPGVPRGVPRGDLIR